MSGPGLIDQLTSTFSATLPLVTRLSGLGFLAAGAVVLWAVDLAGAERVHLLLDDRVFGRRVAAAYPPVGLGRPDGEDRAVNPPPYVLAKLALHLRNPLTRRTVRKRLALHQVLLDCRLAQQAGRQPTQNLDLVQNVKQFVPVDQGKDLDREIVI